jgi:hypothetical protein
MNAGTVALTLLLSILSTDPSDVVPMNNHHFRFPLQPIPPEQRARIAELQLWYSTDQGATWHECASAPPDGKDFDVNVTTDGLYWFAICVYDKLGGHSPKDLTKLVPRGKVLIDSVRPDVHIVSAKREGDSVVVRWDIKELNPDLSTLKLEYRTQDRPFWFTAAVTPALQGEGSFRCSDPGPVAVRVQLKDQADNTSSAEYHLPAVGVAAAPAIVPAASQNPVPTVGNSPSWNSNNESAGVQPLPPTPSPLNMDAAASRALPNLEPERSAPARPPQEPPHWVAAGSGGPQVTSYHPELENRSTTNAAAAPTPAPTPPSRWSSNPDFPLQIVNTTQVSLDYEITRKGPSGVGSVELYLTEDEGRTWRRYYSDQGLRPPMQVNLPGEGVYGLRLVVGSRAGLGRRPPQPGDLPSLRVVVDTTPPAIKLLPPQTDAQRRDAIVLTWEARDNNELPANPVTLEWAERPDGVWKPIATDLSNGGRYSWRLNETIPYRVYLRLLVKDMAGNVAVDETPEPVLIDLSEPEGHLIGVKAVGKRD